MPPDTYTAPEHGWTCFHCGETFPSGTEEQYRRARDHFGTSIDATVACQIKAGEERGLLMALRRAEQQLERYREDDSDADRAMARMQSDHAIALRREEEKGYARALRDTNYSEPSAPTVETKP